MDALGGLEEIVEQADFCANVGNKRKNRRAHAFGRSVSPNMQHSKVAREKKVRPPAAQPLPKPISKKPAPAPSVAPARLGQAITTYRILVETFRQRADELELSRSEIDRIAGLPSGYAGKILSVGAAKKPKRMGMISLENMLATLGLKIILIEDEAATARTLALRTPVDQAQQRFGNVCRISAKLLAPPSQPTSPPLLTVVPAKRSARRSKYG
jgi:hypothetical protein